MKFGTRILAPVVGVVMGLSLAACGPSQQAPGAAMAQPAIVGAGATFPAPVYTKWAEDYKTAGLGEVNYQAVGSGAGITQIKGKTVDFGASDKPLKADVLDAAGLYQFPTVMGGVVPVYNLPGVTAGQLKLSGQVLGDIYLGKIKTWNAPAITALNPDIKLPATAISVAYRADGSGTTFLYTSYLAGVNAAFSTTVGASDSVKWPVGAGYKGNDGVAAAVQNTAGGIGYVEFAYAKQNNITWAAMQNKDGQFVQPSADTFSAAAAGADWANAPGNYMLLLNQPGAQSWPITGATFILVYKTQDDPKKAAAVLKFYDWAYSSGDLDAVGLDYVPLPDSVKALVRTQWSQQIKGTDGSAIYTPAS